MIIRFTQQDRAEIDAAIKPYEDEAHKILDQIMDLPTEEFTYTDNGLTPLSERAKDLTAKFRNATDNSWKAREDAYNRIEERRFKRIESSPQKIITDAHTQTDAIVALFLKGLRLISPKPNAEEYSKIYDEIRPLFLFPNSKAWKTICDADGEATRLNADQIIDLITENLHRHYSKLNINNAKNLTEYIKETVLEALKETPDQTIILPPFFPMYHDNFMDTLPQINSRTINEDAKGNYYITINRTKINMTDTEGLVIALGVPTHKLLSSALELVTANQKHNTVFISTKDYFQSIGYDISDPEVFKKNITRTNQYLLTMQRMIVSEAKEKKRRKKITNMNIVTKTSIDNDFITIQFHPEYVSYLKNRNTIMQYPRALLGIDARSTNAYRMGYKMATHSSIDNNIVRGSNNTLEVETLYNVTDLPAIETVREQRNSWSRSIRNPFETALETLVEAKVITKWYYCKPKGKKMNPQERETSRAKYETWIRSYIHFEMKDAPDRLDAIRKKKQDAENPENTV